MTTMSELYFLHPTGEVWKVLIYTIDVKIEFVYFFCFPCRLRNYSSLKCLEITPSDFGKFFTKFVF